MKKALFYLLCFVCSLVSCTSNSGSKELNIDAVKITTLSGKTNDCSNAITVVPGTYKLEWAKSTTNKAANLRDLGVTVKLKLNKTLSIENESDLNSIAYGLSVIIVDANGNDISPLHQDLHVSKGINTLEPGKMYDESEAQRLLEFLKSAPGTEAEFTFTNQVWSNEDIASTDDLLQTANTVRIVINDYNMEKQ